MNPIEMKRLIFVLLTGLTLSACQTKEPSREPQQIPQTEQPTSVPTCDQKGTISLEKWSNIPGESVSSIPVNTAPSSKADLTTFEIPANTADNYGVRVRGYICAPTTGSYTFYVSGDNESQLFLSTSADPAGRRLMASVPTWTNPREWTKFSSQTSQTVTLTANQPYYIEALMKEGAGGDHLAVGWKLPNGTLERPIPGSHLVPFGVTSSPAPSPTATHVPVTVNLSGSAAGGIQAEFTVYVNSTVIGKGTATTSAKDYVMASSIQLPSISRVMVQFTNDGTDSSGGDRNLYLNHIRVGVGPNIPSTASGVKYDKGALDGVDVVNGQVAMPWNGTMIFPISQASPSPSPSPTVTASPSPSPTVTSSPVACSSTGKILLERWNNITNPDPSALPVGTTPSATETPTLFEARSNIADNYGTRMRGFLCVPVTGDYTFYIAGDDRAELHLSTNDSYSNRRKIASVPSWTNSREWTKHASQTSAAVRLEAGKRYYVEALHHEGGGGDNLAVGWKLPNGTLERPIPGTRLSPASGVSPGPTSSPSPAPTPTSSPSPTPSPTGGAGLAPIPARPSTWSAPLNITAGGTYAGNWRSTDQDTPAVRISTAEPVIIQNCNVSGPGHLFYTNGANANVTIRNCAGFNTGRPVRKDMRYGFVVFQGFKNVLVENNYMENTMGMYFHIYNGNGSASETIRVLRNRARNIDGRWSDGSTSFAQFVQFNSIRNLRGVEIAWNHVMNTPDQSFVEDNINMYNSRGTSDSPIRIHHNYIQGAYPYPANGSRYTGGGIITDGDGDANTCAAYIHATENHLVNLGNYSMGIAGGNNIRYANNRAVNSFRYPAPDSRYMTYWASGYWAKDYYYRNSTFNNFIENNVSGIQYYTGRNDGNLETVAEGTTFRNNTILQGTITQQMEVDEQNRFLNLLSTNGVRVGTTR